jgi:iron(III) transport system substrate-binding protein
MKGSLPLLIALAAVLIAPIALRPRSDMVAGATERTLVIITPHNEAIRYEFGRAFAAHYHAQTGQRVRVDWRTPGGTSEIARYVASEYLAAFQYYWTQTLKRPWSGTIERAFANPKTILDDTPGDDTPEQQARRAFLDSNVSARLDLFFGGGVFDFESQATAGYIVDGGFVAAHPELFNDGVIPQRVSGEPYWDPRGRWVGTVVSSFGICYNSDALKRLGITQPPGRWEDLADPRYFHQIALANPTQSSSVNKSFEMVIQEQMQRIHRENALVTPDESQAIRDGWARAMQWLMKIGANARYFTDASTKISLDVGTGEAAAGMTIDFYGRFQSEAMRRADGSSPMHYVDVIGGSSVGVDPIGMFRGAPSPDMGREFTEFVMSVEGQKLWNWKPGTPDGPQHYALRRLPVLPSLYAAQFQPLRSDPEVNPYEIAKTFTYHEKWSSPLFRSIAFVFRVMCIDPHDELATAWRALIDAGFPPQASGVFSDVSAVDYATANGKIREALGPNKIKEVQLAKEIADHFRAQYRHAAELARAGH